MAVLVELNIHTSLHHYMQVADALAAVASARTHAECTDALQSLQRLAATQQGVVALCHSDWQVRSWRECWSEIADQDAMKKGVRVLSSQGQAYMLLQFIPQGGLGALLTASPANGDDRALWMELLPLVRIERATSLLCVPGADAHACTCEHRMVVNQTPLKLPASQVQRMLCSGALSQPQLLHLALCLQQSAMQLLSEPGAGMDAPVVPVALAGSAVLDGPAGTAAGAGLAWAGPSGVFTQL